MDDFELKTYPNNWTDRRLEVKTVCQQLNISTVELSEVNINHWQEIEEKIWKKFSHDKSSIWIWETLKNPTYGFHIDFKYLYLPDLFDKKETLWFLLNESVNQKTKFWMYEGKIEAFSKVIEEVFFDEILIVSKKYDWLISYNHHNILVGTEKMIEPLKSFEKASKKDKYES